MPNAKPVSYHYSSVIAEATKILLNRMYARTLTSLQDFSIVAVAVLKCKVQLTVNALTDTDHPSTLVQGKDASTIAITSISQM